MISLPVGVDRPAKFRAEAAARPEPLSEPRSEKIPRAATLAEAGVGGVPAYLTCGEVFLGRQHLPMIRWLLEGEKGPVPI